MVKIKGTYGVWNNSLSGRIFGKWEKIYKLKEWMLQLYIKRLLAAVLDVSPAMRHRGGNNEKLVWDHGGVTVFSDRGRGPTPSACSGRRVRAWKNYSCRDFRTSPKKKCETRTIKLQASQVKMEAITHGKVFFLVNIVIFFVVVVALDHWHFNRSTQF